VLSAHVNALCCSVDVLTRGGSRMREIRPSGSEEGAVSNHRPYSNSTVRIMVG
jgi:hypothetical protein